MSAHINAQIMQFLEIFQERYNAVSQGKCFLSLFTFILVNVNKWNTNGLVDLPSCSVVLIIGFRSCYRTYTDLCRLLMIRRLRLKAILASSFFFFFSAMTKPLARIDLPQTQSQTHMLWFKRLLLSCGAAEMGRDRMEEETASL